MSNRSLRVMAAIATMSTIGIIGIPAAATAAPVSPATASGPVAGLNSLGSVTCPTAGTCVSVGSKANGNGGAVSISAATGAVKVWPGQLVDEAPNGLACASRTSCLAASDDAVETVKVSSGAMKVTARPKRPKNGIVALDAIACAGTKSCYAVGFEGTEVKARAVVVHVSSTGKLLADTAEPGTGIAAIACPTGSRCLVGDFDSATHVESVKLLNSGHLGASHTMPAHTYVQFISCFQTRVCYALGGNNTAKLVRTDELFPVSPKTGAIGKVVKIGSGFSGISMTCVSASRCLVAGFRSTPSGGQAELVTVNRGRAGKPVRYPGLNLDSAACASATHCYGVGLQKSGAFVEKIKA